MSEGETWTVMVYLAGDNSLTEFCVQALNEMKQVGSSEPGEGFNIIAQFDPRDSILPTTRYRIKKGGSLSGDIIDQVCDGSFFHRESSKKQPAERSTKRLLVPYKADTGDPHMLFNFLSFCIERYRTQHYLVVLAGHGAGTETDYLLKDESSNGYLTIPELKKVFQDIDRFYKPACQKRPIIDVLGMDVCCMSMAEICYELRGLVQVAVGCESYNPAAGWPYATILERLKREFIFSPREETATDDLQSGVGRSIVEEFVKHYRSYDLGGVSVDQAAVDVRKIDCLKEGVANLARALIDEFPKSADSQAFNKFRDAIVLAHWEAQSYNGELFVDLFDFCHCLHKRYDGQEVRATCDHVMEIIKEHIVLESCYAGPVYQYSYGVSIYFPWAQIAVDYENLDFPWDSGWREFLKIYTTETRRNPRNGEDTKLLERNKTEVVMYREVDERGDGNPIHSMRNPPIVPSLRPCGDESLDRDCISKLYTESVSGSKNVT
jgi:hypothetical protein